MSRDWRLYLADIRTACDKVLKVRRRPTTEMHMRTFTAVIESCPETGLFVGYVPGFPGPTPRVRPSTS